MEKVYVVMTESKDTGDAFTDILDGKYFTDKDDARRAMLDDLREEKDDHRDCGESEETHFIDSCSISTEVGWYKNWNVVELFKNIKN